jgi:hypothetical protein
MIAESAYWRRDLFRAAEELRRKSVQKVWRESSVWKLESTIMLGCFAVRRLIDSGRMPDSFKDEPVRCVILERTRVAANRIRYLPPLEEEQLVELYDFDRATDSAIEVHGVLNQFVHSYHLRYIGAMNGSDVVVLVASDKSRSRRLLAFWLSDIARLLERAALLEASRGEHVGRKAAGLGQDGTCRRVLPSTHRLGLDRRGRVRSGYATRHVRRHAR